MQENLVNALVRGATVVTASQRQARVLQQAYGDYKTQAHCSAWPTPDILPFVAWLDRVWVEATVSVAGTRPPFCDHLLHSNQEKIVWEDIIRQSAVGSSLLQPYAMAERAYEAWQLCAQWRISVPGPDEVSHDDVRAFGVWAIEFVRRCRQFGWQSQAHLPDRVGEAITRKYVSRPSAIVFFGFSELTPQQEQLLTCLQDCGCLVECIDPVMVPAKIVRYEFSGFSEEILAAAQWARQYVSTGAARVGVVVPDLHHRRREVIRVFDKAFRPKSERLAKDGDTHFFNVTLGCPLIEYPLVYDAILMLKSGFVNLSVAEVGVLLRSPFISGANKEATGRAQLDVRCRRKDLDISIADLYEFARTAHHAAKITTLQIPRLTAALGTVVSIFANTPQFQKPSAWVQTFTAILGAWGWPGDRTVTSDEYQTLEAWQRVLATFATCDIVVKSWDFRAAWGALHQLITEEIFQPESNSVPVQIMGIFEATGLSFEHLWITDMQADIWPSAPSPHPFIPINIQRRHKAPHSSPARELEFAQKLTKFLLGSAAHVVLSHSQRQGDVDLRPSPLTVTYPISVPPTISITGASELYYAQKPALQGLYDSQASQWPAGSEVRLGTGVFKDQAACPFRAFARARLHVTSLPQPEAGFNALGRGTLVHAVMEHLWRQLGSHAELSALSDADLRMLIQSTVGVCVEQFAQIYPRIFTPVFRRIESARIEELVWQWLTLEKFRRPFKVLYPEERQKVMFGGITVDIVPDRIDVLEDGGQIVIDYKTGTPKIAAWFGDRPDEPQLLLYGLAQSNIVAIAFGQLRKGDTRIIGIGEVKDIIDGIRVFSDVREAESFGSWPVVLAKWHQVLDSLGEAFRLGHAEVDPKSLNHTCGYCDLGPLCRISALGKGVTDDEEESA